MKELIRRLRSHARNLSYEDMPILKNDLFEAATQLEKAQPQVPEPISRALALINTKEVLHSGICPVAAQRIIFQMSEILTTSQEQENRP